MTLSESMLPLQPTILVVDDEPANVRLLQTILELGGCRVIPAYDGATAIESARAHTPDLIFLDIMLPGVDGFEICRRLKDDPALREIPVIFVSALSETIDKIRAFSVGGVDYVTKPIQGAEVLARMRTHLQLRRMQLDLQALNQELESFSYSVSHDLRAPLHSISGFSQILLEDYGERLDEEGRRHVQRIESAARRMNDLIDDMLLLSRISRQELRITNVDLSGMAREVAALLRQSDPERQVQFEIAPDLMISGDERLLRIVFENLLGNAWKYTGKQPAARIEFGSSEVDGRTSFFVRDNGAGFDKADAEKLCTPFQRLHSEKQFEGTGIGLATVRRALRRLGGDVSAHGEVGKGATFIFTIGS